MRVLVFSPHPLTTISGNVVTLQRIQKHLSRRGHKVQIVVPPSEERVDLVEEAIAGFKPDVLHWYHARKTGHYLTKIRQRREIPSIVSVGGTDLNEDCHDPVLRALVGAVFALSRGIVAASSSMARRVQELFPDELVKVRFIEKGVEVGDRPFDLELGESDRLVLLPGGIRPVKNQLFVFEALGMDPPAPDVRLLLAGPLLDAAYGSRVLKEIAARSWVRHIATIPHDSMGTALRRSKVVLNTSLSEGGSNAVIEAMVCGRPVLASDIPGNRDFIRNGETGILYRDAEGFRTGLERLLRDGESIALAAQAEAKVRFSAAKEAEEHERVYAEVV